MGGQWADGQALADELLPLTGFDFLQCLFIVLGTFVVVGRATPYVLVALVPLGAAFYLLRHYYLASSREVKRLVRCPRATALCPEAAPHCGNRLRNDGPDRVQDALARSPVYSWLSTSLDGLASIRAFGMQRPFGDQFVAYQDANTRAILAFIQTSRWLGLRLDLLSCVFLTATVFTLAATRASLPPGLVGLSLVYAMNLTGLFQWCARQSAEVENLSMCAIRTQARATWVQTLQSPHNGFCPTPNPTPTPTPNPTPTPA